MENEHISNLFQKIRSRLAKQHVNTEAVKKIIFEETRIEITDADFAFKKGVLSIRTNPIKKNELHLKKEKIISRISNETGLKIHDLR